MIIYGPTATGKTDLAIILARKFNGELISADSRQVYKKLDIGSGKVSSGSSVEKHDKYWIVDGITIHGFDLVEPETKFNAADFISFANTAISRIVKKGKRPIIVGGTGFYIKSLVDGLASLGIGQDTKLRNSLEKLTKEKLLQKLLDINPKKANSMNESDRQNPRRLIRAIEISLSPQSRQSTVKNYQSKVNHQIFGLTAPNVYLYKKADKSFANRLNNGMVDEIKTLLAQKISPQWFESLGLEYRWLTKFVLGKATREEAILKAEGELHSFIRRQKTWFKQFKNITLFDVSSNGWQSELEKNIKL